MIYRELGRSGVKVSALGFGSMRWQSEEACQQVIRRGMELGMNYLDTSTGYVGGQSERWCGSAVRDRRQEIYFSSKSHWAQAPDAGAVHRAIEGSLRKTGLDSFDFYQIWGLQRMEALERALSRGGTIEGVRRAQSEGLIRYGLGFTFHGDAPLFKAAVDTGEFLCATVSYNLSKRRQGALLDYAAAHGVGVITMNPLAGGVLARDDPSLDFLCLGEYGPWYGALRFLLANKSITTAIVGYRHAYEVDQNVRALEGAEALGDGYRRALAAKMAATKLLNEDFCTGCGYCAECPSGFDPTKLMQAMRDYDIYGAGAPLSEWLRDTYMGQNPQEVFDLCVECGWCEEQCPQHLGIIAQIRRARAAFVGAS